MCYLSNSIFLLFRRRYCLLCDSFGRFGSSYVVPVVVMVGVPVVGPVCVMVGVPICILDGVTVE